MLHAEVAALIGSLVDGLAYIESTGGGNVFVDHLPSAPDRAVAVYTQPGPEADSKLPYDQVRFQVVTRSEDDGTWALEKWAAIRSKLHGKRNFRTPLGTWVVYIVATQASPFNVGFDQEGRARFGAVYRAEFVNATEERQ